MEDRALLAGVAGGPVGVLANVSPAVQADLAKIHQDEQQLNTDTQALAATLQADQRAIRAAIASSTGVQDAQKVLSADEAAWRTTLQTDMKALSAAHSATARQSAMAQFQADSKTAAQTLALDQEAVATAIANDPGVQAARQQLATDALPITNDRAALQADHQQLLTDLHNPAPNPTTPPSGNPPAA